MGACFQVNPFKPNRRLQKKLTMKDFLKFFAPMLGLALLVGACGGPPPGPAEANEITIGVDENYQPIIEREMIEWMDASKGSGKINPIYRPESEVLRKLLTDSIGLAILSRQLTPDECEPFVKKGFNPRQIMIAYDGIAIITNPANEGLELSLEQLRGIATGEITQWKQIDPNSKHGDLSLVFDNQGSSTLRYIMDTVCMGAPLGKNIFGAKNNPDVIAYVAKYPSAIGIIGVNWISDLDNPEVRQFRKEISVVGLSKKSGEKAFLPYQYYLRTGEYPLSRNMYVINCESTRGLESNFTGFMYSERSLKVIQKSGLVPSHTPVRLITLKKQNFSVN